MAILFCKKALIELHSPKWPITYTAASFQTNKPIKQYKHEKVAKQWQHSILHLWMQILVFFVDIVSYFLTTLRSYLLQEHDIPV